MSNVQGIREAALNLRINVIERSHQAQEQRAESAESLTRDLGNLVESQASLLEEAISEASFLAETLDSIREDRDQAVLKVRELNRRIAELELSNAFPDAKPALIDELETQLADARAEIEELQARSIAMEEEIDSLEDEAQGLQREVDDLAEELEDRPNKHDYCEIEDALADAVEKNEVLQLEIESRDVLINELKRALRNVKAKLKRRESKD